MMQYYQDCRQRLIDYLEFAEENRDLGKTTLYRQYQLFAVDEMLKLKRSFDWKIRNEDDRIVLMACRAIEYYFSRGAKNDT